MKFIKNHPKATVFYIALMLFIFITPIAVTLAQDSGRKATKNLNLPTCNGTSISHSCQIDGVNYATYIYHPESAAVTHVVHHPAVTHTVTTYVQANEGKYAGSQATAKCADGSYNGADPYYSWTCNYHGGVAAIGPFSNTQTITDQAAYDETVTDAPAQAAYYDKVVK